MRISKTAFIKERKESLRMLKEALRLNELNISVITRQISITEKELADMGISANSSKKSHLTDEQLAKLEAKITTIGKRKSPEASRLIN